MTQLLLRTAQLDDLTTVVSWLRSRADCELWAGHRVTYPVNAATLHEAIEWGIASSYSATSVAAPGAVVAFGQLVPKPNQRLHLARVIIQPERRGSGLGKALVSELLSATASFSPARLSLNVARHNAPALRLYTSLGFVEVERPSDEPHSDACYLERAPR